LDRTTTSALWDKNVVYNITLIMINKKSWRKSNEKPIEIFQIKISNQHKNESKETNQIGIK
jgi:hypothetical protein